MRVAQHWSLCRDDALDAYQRALEIYLRRVDTLDPTTEIAWMKVVVKNEALAVRRARTQLVPVEDVDAEAAVAESEQRPVDDLLAGRERTQRSVEALRRIKPDEAKALVLKAQGLSYAEIGESLGWSYTKVNRCLTEGRARFLKVYAQIEAGEECERFAPTLAALVGGTASAAALLELRPHIRNCPSCRATVRELHATRLGRLAAGLPLPLLLAPLRWVWGRHGEAPHPGPDGIVLRPGEPGTPELSPLDGIVDLDNLAAPLEFAAKESGGVIELKAQTYQWMHRLSGTDVATGAQIAAGTGGGRIATIGAVIGLCLSSLGAGTVCVVTGVVENPFAAGPPKSVVRKAEPPRTPRVTTEPRRRPDPIVTATPEPPPRRSAAPERPRRSRRGATDQPASPSSHEQPAPAPAPAGATQDFSFEQTAPTAPAIPAAAPSNGGGEFAP